MRTTERTQTERLLQTASSHVLCTPHNTTPQPAHLAIWVEVAGDIHIRDAAGNELTYASVPKGLFLMQGHLILTTTTATLYLWS
jgi:hypothetical protein